MRDDLDSLRTQLEELARELKDKEEKVYDLYLALAALGEQVKEAAEEVKRLEEEAED